jgi:hypothetical protein
MSAEIDWDTYEPTRAVRAASMTLFTADAVEAMCFGWVPQAREALSVALDIEEMARAIHASDFPDDDWDQEVHTGLRDECLKNARAVRAAILGADS